MPPSAVATKKNGSAHAVSSRGRGVLRGAACLAAFALFATLGVQLLLRGALPPNHPSGRHTMLAGSGAPAAAAHSLRLLPASRRQHTHRQPHAVRPAAANATAASARQGNNALQQAATPAAQALQLLNAYSAALTALSAALGHARLRAEEAAALKEQMDSLRHTLLPHAQPQPGQRELPLEQQLLETGAMSSREQQQHHQQQPQVAVAGRSSSSSSHAVRQQEQRHTRMVIGVFTGFNNVTALTDQRNNYTRRRAALRATWFPGDMQQRHMLEVEYGLVLRFIIGTSTDPAQEAALQREQQHFGDILRLPLQESYSQLPNKTRTFFKLVADAWDPDWVVKADDDVFLNLSRLIAASGQWDKMGAQYVGCMKHGYPWRQPGTRWYEPQHLLIGHTYYLHSYGSIYALGRAARAVITRNFDHLRLLANEDTSVGAWMLGADVKHFEDMRLCSPVCTPSSVGVLRNECAGLCDPLRELPQLHANSNCSGPPGRPLRYHASYWEHRAFEAMWVE